MRRSKKPRNLKPVPIEPLPSGKRPSTRFLKRYVLHSDDHGFVGRMFGLGIVTLSFDTHDELAKHADCKYAVDVLDRVKNLAHRVESLNLVGDLLWPSPFPFDFQSLPVSQYDWLVISADVFLMRYISVVDCAILLANEVHEAGLAAHKCTLKALRDKKLPLPTLSLIAEMIEDQGNLRAERNSRVHHGVERVYTIDDTSFRTAALFTHRGSGMIGHDYYGRPINVPRSFREGLANLQRTFNRTSRRLVRQLDKLYDLMWSEFEDRFGPRIAAATHGLNAGSRD